MNRHNSTSAGSTIISVVCIIIALAIMYVISKHYPTDIFCYAMSLIFKHFSISVAGYTADIFVLLITIFSILGILKLFDFLRENLIVFWVIVALIGSFFYFNLEPKNTDFHLGDEKPVEKQWHQQSVTFPRLDR
jgi:hypothetical protein